MEATINTLISLKCYDDMLCRFGKRAFEPEIIDKDGRVSPRFHYLLGELEWNALDINTRVGLILEFVSSLESDIIGTLQEIPF
jgi:hypothetical protein